MPCAQLARARTEAMVTTVAKDMPRVFNEVAAAKELICKRYEPLMGHPAGFVKLPPFPSLPARPQLQ